MINVEIRFDGPVWDGRAAKAIGAALDESTAGVSEVAEIDLKANFDATFKNPTGFYKSQNSLQPLPDGWRLHDSDVIYGHWLEGTGSRNKTTRFKGYWNYRRTATALRRKVPQIIAPIFKRFLERL